MTVRELIARLSDSRIPLDATIAVQTDDCVILPLRDCVFYPDMPCAVFLDALPCDTDDSEAPTQDDEAPK